MIRSLLLLYFLLVSSALAQSSTGANDTRPINFILDSTGTLSLKEVSSLSQPLKHLHETQGIDIINVILPSLDDLPPQRIAKEFARTWCNDRIHAVILHVPNHKESPWIFPGGSLFHESSQREEIAANITKAISLSRAETTTTKKIEAASTATAHALRPFFTSQETPPPQIHPSRESKTTYQQEPKRAKKIPYLGKVLKWIPLVILPLLLVASLVFFINHHKRESAPRMFSSTLPPRRLGAPYSGGNYVACRLRSR